MGRSLSSPGYEAGDLNKAVKWAIDSAIQLDCPSLTAVVLPQWEEEEEEEEEDVYICSSQLG